MKIHYFYLGLILINLFGNVILGGYLWRRRHLPSVKMLLLTIASSMEISIMFFILTITPSEEVAYFTARARFLGLGFLNVFAFLCVLEYTQHGAWITPRRVVLLCVIPVLMQVVLWVIPGGHNAFFKEWAFIPTAEGYNVEHRLLAGFHDWYGLHTIFVTVGSLFLLGRYAIEVDSSKRRALGWILLGVILAAGGAVSPIIIGEPPGLRLLPISMGLFTLCLGWGMIRYDFYEVLPIAYDLIFTSMSDVVLALDNQKCIVRANPAAERALNLPHAKIIGRPFVQVMPQAADSSLFAEGVTRFEVGGAGRNVYLGKCQPVRVYGYQPGWLIVLHDVTARRRAEADLSASERRAKALADAMSKVTTDQAREQASRVKEFIRMSIRGFRAPVQAMHIAVLSLENEPDADQRAQDIAQLTAEVDSFSAMVDDLAKTFVTESPAENAVD